MPIPVLGVPLLTLAIAVGLTAFVAPQAQCSEPGTIQLQWDPSLDSRLVHYRLYYGQHPGEYETIIDLGTETSAKISGLDPEVIYYFSVKAIGSHGQESEFSNELTSGAFRYLISAREADGAGDWIEVVDMNRSHERILPTGLSEYDARYGQPRIAVGDIDGDGRDEVVIGYVRETDTGSAHATGLFQVLDDDFSPLLWGTVTWPDYANASGDTYPALGDLDGDGKDEILIGLGPGGDGLVEVFQYADGALSSLGWTSVEWSEYNAINGATQPALGDLNGDGRDELVIGLRASDGVAGVPGGAFLVKSGIDIAPPTNGAFAQRTVALSQGLQGRLLTEQGVRFADVSWTEYASRVGETRPAIGDLNGDGTAEIVIGFGPGGNGYLEIFDYQDSAMMSLGLVGVGFDEYNRFNGETRPAIGDLDGDGKSEILVGFGAGGEGILESIQDASEQFSYSTHFQVGADTGRDAGGGIWPVYKREHAAGIPTEPVID